MNLPDFVLMVPGETVALILLLAFVLSVLVGAGVWAHLVNSPRVECDDEFREALEELHG